MSDSWLEIDAGGVTSRVELKPGLTRLGGAGSDVVLEGSPRGELHVWDDPPKVVFLGAHDPPEIDGEVIDERALVGDELVRWAGAAIRFRTRRQLPPPAPPEPAAPPVLEEIPLKPPVAPVVAPSAGASASSAPAVGAQVSPGTSPAASPTLGAPAPVGGAPVAGTPEARAWARVRAGMLVELGLADRRTSGRWQEAVMRNEFDADVCARDLLANTDVAPDDPRLLDRSGRLLRDFLMTPLLKGARGASRRMRKATKSGVAFVVAQIIVILIYTSILIVVMILVRLKWDTSFDAMFDGILGR